MRVSRRGGAEGGEVRHAAFGARRACMRGGVSMFLQNGNMSAQHGGRREI